MRGKITKKFPYKSGKGFVIGIDGTDYMFFGFTDVKMGEQVEFETGKPMNDGKQTIKEIRPTAIESFVDSAPPKPFPTKETAAVGATPTKDEIITRLACLKAASEVYSGAQQKQDGFFELVRKMEKWARGEWTKLISIALW